MDLEPTPSINVSYYNFDGSPGKDQWEIRQNGSIMTDAQIIGISKISMEDAIGHAKKYVDDARTKGFDARLTERNYLLVCYLQTYPYNKEAYALNFMTRDLASEYRETAKTLLHIWPMCWACSLDLREHTMCPRSYEGKTIVLCKACASGAHREKYKWYDAHHGKCIEDIVHSGGSRPCQSTN